MYDTVTSTINSEPSCITTSSITINTGTAGTTGLSPYSISIDPNIITGGTLPYGYNLNPPKKEISPKLTNKYENNSHYRIKRIKEIVPDKVFEFQIYTNARTKTIKTVCSPEDTPALEYACALALAKVFYSDYTLDGIINYIIPYKILSSKIYLREIKHGIKIIKENRRIALLGKEQEEIKARQKKKRAEQKRRRAEKRERDQVNIIKKAILESK